MAELAKDQIENLTAEDMRDYMYGHIQSMIEGGNNPENVVFQYFMPPIPFGPELASFMDIGPTAKNFQEEGFTVNDMMRAAVNFATIVDYVPEIKNENSDDNVIDINTLISSGVKITSLYESILSNLRIFDNKRSEEDEEKLAALRKLLYVDPVVQDSSETDDSVEPQAGDDLTDDDLLDDFDSDAEVDLADIFDDGASIGDMITDPNQISPPTNAMKLYEALMANFNQVQLAAADQLKLISPNDPNAPLRIKVLKQKVKAARQKWEVQGRKRRVESIMARIEQLSQGGMPEYVAKLRERFEGNKMLAALFSSEEQGVGFLTEEAYYTALRPNGILTAPGLMKVTISNTNSARWSKFTKKGTSASFRAPAVFVFGGARGKLELNDENTQRSFFKNDFEISFEIVQGLIDRPWFAKEFVECRAYSTIDPRTNEALDAVNQITQLSDGKIPPEEGKLPAIPMTVYFIRNLKVKSSSLANLSEQDKSKVKGSGGFSLFGFGSKAAHTSDTIEASYSTAGTKGEITANGTYLIAMSSVYLKKSPDPDFETFPKDKWT